MKTFNLKGFIKKIEIIKTSPIATPRDKLLIHAIEEILLQEFIKDISISEIEKIISKEKNK